MIGLKCVQLKGPTILSIERSNLSIDAECVLFLWCFAHSLYTLEGLNSFRT